MHSFFCKNSENFPAKTSKLPFSDRSLWTPWFSGFIYNFIRQAMTENKKKRKSNLSEIFISATINQCKYLINLWQKLGGWLLDSSVYIVVIFLNLFIYLFIFYLTAVFIECGVTCDRSVSERRILSLPSVRQLRSLSRPFSGSRDNFTPTVMASSSHPT